MARVRLLVVWTICVWGSAASSAAATVGEWVSAVEAAAITSGVVPPGSQARVALDEAKGVLTEAGVLDEEISSFFGRYTAPDAVALARRRQDRYSAAVLPAVRSVKQIVSLLPGTVLTPQSSLVALVNEQQLEETRASLSWDLRVLARLERKYGPQSAKLNGLETLVAYALQRTPGFGIDRATGYPGPLEAVLAYSASYVTRSDEKMRLVGVAELGLRQYIFAPGWGAGAGRWAWLRPGYVSYGVAVAGQSDDPLRSPLRGASRYGGFFGWGEMKVAWLATGSDKRVLVTQQVQLIPWVF